MPDARLAALAAMVRAQNPCLGDHHGGPCLLPAHTDGDHMAAFPRLPWAVVNLDALASSPEVRAALADVAHNTFTAWRATPKGPTFVDVLVDAILAALAGTSAPEGTDG